MKSKLNRSLLALLCSVVTFTPFFLICFESSITSKPVQWLVHHGGGDTGFVLLLASPWIALFGLFWSFCILWGGRLLKVAWGCFAIAILLGIYLVAI